MTRNKKGTGLPPMIVLSGQQQRADHGKELPVNAGAVRLLRYVTNDAGLKRTKGRK
jgi:hypothetical protein